MLALLPVDAAIVYGLASSLEARMERLEEWLHRRLTERMEGRARVERFLDAIQAGARGEKGVPSARARLKYRQGSAHNGPGLRGEAPQRAEEQDLDEPKHVPSHPPPG